MSLLSGLSLLLGLLLFTLTLVYLSELTKKVPLVLMCIMIFGDIIIAATFYYVGIEFVEDIKKFKLGMGLSFMIISFSRGLIFLMNAKKKGYL